MRETLFIAPNDQLDTWEKKVWNQVDDISETFWAADHVQGSLEPDYETDTFGRDYLRGYDYFVEECDNMSLTIALNEGDPWAILEEVIKEFYEDGAIEDHPVYLEILGHTQYDDQTLTLNLTWTEESPNIPFLIRKRPIPTDYTKYIISHGPTYLLPPFMGIASYFDKIIAKRMKETI